jgi:hypothetical protein
MAATSVVFEDGLKSVLMANIPRLDQCTNIEQLDLLVCSDLLYGWDQVVIFVDDVRCMCEALCDPVLNLTTSPGTESSGLLA